MNSVGQEKLSAQEPAGTGKMGNDCCGAVTTQEKELWNGFCEIESEPVGCAELAIPGPY